MDEKKTAGARSKSRGRAKVKAKSPSNGAGAERHEFKAETARLLNLLIHSVYSDKDIFLRELISNAADACEKLRYETIAHPDLLGDDPDMRITVRLDKAAKTLSVEDNGIGMDREELISNLGVIARSGTRAFLDTLKDAKQGGQLIGQFGVGFYAAFMVAREVEVFSRRAGTDQTFRWASTGAEDFTVTAAEAGEVRARGTLVRLHLADEATAYLEAPTVERVIKAYSSHVPVPIQLAEATDGEAEEPRQVTDASALWMKPRSQVDADAYKEFYAHVSGHFDEPALTVHYRAEGRHEYAVLLFVPSMRPFDLFDPERKGRVKLYVRRVFITDGAELLPGYLRFVRGVIDSEDMPLNISREMLQNNPLLDQIRKAVTNRVLSDLARTAEKDEDAFLKVWENFGAVIKEGLYEDFERRDELFGIARFRTTHSGEGWRGLKDYVAGMKENQTEIYFITGDSLEQIRSSPQLEGFAARDVEVLLLADPVDSFWTMTALGYEGKPFKSITQGNIDLSKIPLKEGAGETGGAPAESAVASLVALFRQTLGDAVSDVVTSSRLVGSPVCLVAPTGGPDRRLERLLLQRDGSASESPPILEINPNHALVKALAGKVSDTSGREAAETAAWLLYDQARIAEGEGPKDPAKFCARLTENLLKAMG